MTKVTSTHTNKNIVVVSHGTVMSLFVSRHNPIEAFTFWQKLEMPAYLVLSTPHYKLLDVVVAVS